MMHGANMKIERKALTRISNKQFYVTNETATQPTTQINHAKFLNTSDKLWRNI